MKKQKGFSLIELLIVVAIILIIAAIAIPNLLKARISANESSAVGSMRTINTAQVQYAAQCPTSGFAATLTALGPGPGDCTGASILDNLLGVAAPIKSGYKFAFAGDGATPSTQYTLTVNPVTPKVTGQRGFFTDQTGVIRYDPSATATAASNPLQ